MKIALTGTPLIFPNAVFILERWGGIIWVGIIYDGLNADYQSCWMMP